MSPEPHLSLRGVSRHFRVSGRRSVRAVEDIDLDIARGETFGLVGESMHKVDEKSAIADLKMLSRVYETMLDRFIAS